MTSNFKCPNDHTLCTEIFDGMKKAKSDGTPTKCGVSVIVINDNDEILLGVDKNENHWSFFSGSMDEEECLYEAAVRELKEESTIKINFDDFVKYIDDNNDNTLKTDNKKSVCNPFFLLKIANNSIDVDKINKLIQDKNKIKELLDQYKEVDRVQYFNIKNIDELDFASGNVTNSNGTFYSILSNLRNFSDKIKKLDVYTSDLSLLSIEDTKKESDNKKEKKAHISPTTTTPVTTKVEPITAIAPQDTTTTQVKGPVTTTTTTEGTILYVDPNSSNLNMMVSTIKLNGEFEKWIVENGKWIKSIKGGNKRKSKSTKKARRSK